MAISNNSVRVQFTLNTTKEKEKQIADFLDDFINPNNLIKEILYNYIVSNSYSKSLKVTHSEVTQSHSKLLEVTQSEQKENNKVTQSEGKLLKVSNSEEKLLEVNELEDLSKFI
jgi:PKD repeat protein